MVFSPDWSTVLPGTPVRVSAKGTHAVYVDRLVDGEWQVLGSAGATTSVDLPGLGEGDHTFRARIESTDYVLGTTRQTTIHVARGATEPRWVGERTIEANHTLSAHVSIDAVPAGVPMDGLMTVKDVATDIVVATVTVGMPFTIRPIHGNLKPGTHTFLVRYLGSADYAASAKTFDVIVTSDTVEATGVGTNYSTFYPVKDGYRDTVTIKGNRQEPSSVYIRVYSPTGSVVKRTTLASAAGTYGYQWNGRTSTGSLRAAGKYKVVQVLTDAFGTQKTFTSYVNLSHRKIITKTAYITKLGSSVSAKGDDGTGSITISTSGGYARLTGKSPDGWVGVGYQFTLPTANVYKSIAFQVYDKGPASAPPALIGLQDFADCPYTSTGGWSESCFDHWKLVGNYTTQWFSAPGSVTYNRHGRTVRGMVSVPVLTHTIYKARVRVVYGILD